MPPNFVWLADVHTRNWCPGGNEVSKGTDPQLPPQASFWVSCFGGSCGRVQGIEILRKAKTDAKLAPAGIILGMLCLGFLGDMFKGKGDKNAKRKKRSQPHTAPAGINHPVRGAGVLLESVQGQVGEIPQEMHSNNAPTILIDELRNAPAGIILGMLSLGFLGDVIGRMWGSRLTISIMAVGAVLLTGAYGSSDAQFLAVFLFSLFFYGG